MVDYKALNTDVSPNVLQMHVHPNNMEDLDLAQFKSGQLKLHQFSVFAPDFSDHLWPIEEKCSYNITFMSMEMMQNYNDLDFWPVQSTHPH